MERCSRTAQRSSQPRGLRLNYPPGWGLGPTPSIREMSASVWTGRQNKYMVTPSHWGLVVSPVVRALPSQQHRDNESHEGCLHQAKTPQLGQRAPPNVATRFRVDSSTIVDSSEWRKVSEPQTESAPHSWSECGPENQQPVRRDRRYVPSQPTGFTITVIR